MDTDATMTGKVCLVTGATAGLGAVTAEALARRGATVDLVGRSRERGEATAEQIRRDTGNASVGFLQADLSQQAEIRQLADAFRERHARLDVLVNNAGGMFLKRQESVDGIEMTFALNHLAYFLLTDLLLDLLKASAPARIVSVSSDSHRWPGRIDFDDVQGRKRYGGLRAYGQSKLANLLFTFELARRLEGTGVSANALHPGFVATSFFGAGGMMGTSARLMQLAARLVAISPEEGAKTSIYLASASEVQGVSGKVFLPLQGDHPFAGGAGPRGRAKALGVERSTDAAGAPGCDRDRRQVAWPGGFGAVRCPASRRRPHPFPRSRCVHALRCSSGLACPWPLRVHSPRRIATRKSAPIARRSRGRMTGSTTTWTRASGRPKPWTSRCSSSCDASPARRARSSTTTSRDATRSSATCSIGSSASGSCRPTPSTWRTSRTTLTSRSPSFLLNPDMTLYGRFGTRSERDESEDISLQGLRKAMAEVLRLHATYATVKPSLEGEAGPSGPLQDSARLSEPGGPVRDIDQLRGEHRAQLPALPPDPRGRAPGVPHPSRADPRRGASCPIPTRACSG